MSIFQQIKSHLSILDVIRGYTTLKKGGQYWKGSCPFHSEKTASFTVSPHKEIFYCFGCQAHGDLIAFIAKIENCTQLEAARLLADRYSIDLPEQISYSSDHAKKNSYFELCKLVAQWTHRQLSKYTEIQNYLRERSISEYNCQYFLLGYFPGGLRSINRFINDMKTHNILVDDLIEANILSRGKSVLYSPFEDRIIFPIKDNMGRFCGFGGRIFKQHDTRAKYYNSRENEFFNKGSLLFGLDLAKKEIQKTNTVLLVEGYTDCIALVGQKYRNTVATLGTACSLQHLRQLSRYAQRLYVLYDGDNAGKQATLRLAELCWEVMIEPFIVVLPSNEDPASLVQSEVDLKPYIEKAQDVFSFYISQLGSDFSTIPLYDKIKQARRIFATLQKVTDPLTRDLLIQKASTTLAIPFETIRRECEPREKKTIPSAIKAPIEYENTTIDSLPQLSKKIFFAIISDTNLLDTKHADYLLDFFPQPLRTLLGTLKAIKNKNPDQDPFNSFFESLNPEMQAYISKTHMQQQTSIEPETFDQLMNQLRRKNWKTAASNIKTKIEQAQKANNHEEIARLLTLFATLKKQVLGTKLL